MTQSQNKTKNITTLALFTCLSLIFSYVEFLIPVPLGIPGVKLGIANLVIIILLYIKGPKDAFYIDSLRILLAGLLFSGVFGTFYSLSGGILSILVMIGLKKLKCFSIVGVSLAGGVTHNLGQLILASLIIENKKIFLYFPVLVFSGIITGVIIGFLAYFLIEKLPKNLF